MITIDDCKAFCDTTPDRVEELARREGLPLVHACALAQHLARGADAARRDIPPR